MVFDEVWVSSRSNEYSYLYPLAIWLGVGVLVALSFVKIRRWRVFGKVVAVLFFWVFATLGADWSIHEKWKIRWAWVKAHEDSLTDAQWATATADGANLSMGPFLYGFLALLSLMAVCAVLAVAFRKTRLGKCRAPAV